MTRRRGLTPEEEALWRKAMRDVAPFRSKRPMMEKLVSPPQQSPGLSGRPPTGLLPARRHHGHAADAGRADPLPRRLQHPFVAGDPRLDRLAGRGRLPVDAVLDLHGHTQLTAHAALLRFVGQARANSARCLLVITGKGAPGAEGAYSQHGAGRGVLRARLQDWLAEEPLRQVVSRASPAHQRHGGAGAFYIFLKR